MTTKYPRPCVTCKRTLRPNTPGSQERYPEAEAVHHARGMCKACYARDHFGRHHLTGQPVREYDHADQTASKKPLPTSILDRLQHVHPPTAHYIRDRRRRGIPATGIRRKVAR